jgi:hypothetical protein
LSSNELEAFFAYSLYGTSNMSKGFEPASADEIKVAIAVKRLLPSARRNDIHAFADGVREMQKRYGKGIGDEAMRQVFEQFPKLATQAFDFLTEEMRQQAYDAAIEIVAGILEDANLRLEDHLRYGDQGVAVTKQAIAAIRATGYPNVNDFGVGNDSLEDVGIVRNPFIHPLAEVIENTEYINSWAFAGVAINSALGWIEADVEKSKAALTECVSRVAPTTDVDKLLYRSRYCDRSLMKLAGYTAEGLQTIARQQHENQ